MYLTYLYIYLHIYLLITLQHTYSTSLQSCQVVSWLHAEGLLVSSTNSHICIHKLIFIMEVLANN